MNKYALLFEDNDNYADQRTKFMVQHLDFLSNHAHQIQAAGPLKNSRTGKPAGGLWIVDANSLEHVEALIESDPFWPTGLRKSIRILEWTQVFSDGKKRI